MAEFSICLDSALKLKPYSKWSLPCLRQPNACGLQVYQKNSTLLLMLLVILQPKNQHEGNREYILPFTYGKHGELLCINNDTFKSIGKF